MAVNKKILGLALLAIVLFLPVVVFGQDTASSVAENIKELAVLIGMAIVVIGWVIAGILYLTAAGAPDKIKTAKQAMIAAIIGTVLVAIAVLGYDVIANIVNNAINEGV